MFGSKHCARCGRLVQWSGIEPSSCPSCGGAFTGEQLGKDTPLDEFYGAMENSNAGPVVAAIVIAFVCAFMGLLFLLSSMPSELVAKWDFPNLAAGVFLWAASAGVVIYLIRAAVKTRKLESLGEADLGADVQHASCSGCADTGLVGCHHCSGTGSRRRFIGLCAKKCVACEGSGSVVCESCFGTHGRQDDTEFS